MYRAESPVPFSDLTSVGFSQRNKNIPDKNLGFSPKII